MRPVACVLATAALVACSGATTAAPAGPVGTETEEPVSPALATPGTRPPVDALAAGAAIPDDGTVIPAGVLAGIEHSAAPAQAEPAPDAEPAGPAPGPPPGPPQGCQTDVDALPDARGATGRDDRRLHRGRVLVAHKSARRLMLYDAGELQGCWRIALGFAPTGHKEVEGDGKTPEGWYRTSDKPWSVFDDAIAIHYPATRDAKDARAARRIGAKQLDAIAAANRRGSVPPQRTAMGGAILIHGGGSVRDWTLGCIALDDDDLAELRAQLPRDMRTHLMIVE